MNILEAWNAVKQNKIIKYYDEEDDQTTFFLQTILHPFEEKDVYSIDLYESCDRPSPPTSLADLLREELTSFCIKALDHTGFEIVTVEDMLSMAQQIWRENNN